MCVGIFRGIRKVGLSKGLRLAVLALERIQDGVCFKL